MTAYIIKETQTLNADRKASHTVNGSLASAKRVASRFQFFQGTVLKIEDTMGRLIAYKEYGKPWVNVLES